MLRINEISSGYGKIGILREISFQVKENEVVAILGSNGAGKTTLLKTISNLIPATSGSVVFQNREITQYPSHTISQLGIAHVPEGGRLFSNMTVYDNLLMGAYNYRKTFRKEFLEEVYNIFPILKDRKKQLAKTLSGGEKQMLSIGRALAGQPKFIMLDEPSQGIAPKLIDEIYNKLTILKEKGLTVLLIEQNVNHALHLAERAYVLENGKIVMDGDSKELLKNDHIKKHYLGL